MNPIESTFAPVRTRTDITKITKGPGSKEAGLAMIKLLEAAEGRWRRLNGSRFMSTVGTKSVKRRSVK